MNLEKYIDEAGKHYQSAYAKLEVWDKEKQVARNKLKAEAVRLTPEAATEENEKYVREYAEKLQAILDELKAGLDEVESRYTQEVKSYYTPNGGMIDANDQALLASGILSDAEVIEMIYRHADNPTMLRVLKQHTERNHIQNLPTEAHRAIYQAAASGEKEMFVWGKFNQLMRTPVNMADSGLAHTDAFANTVLRSDDYIKDCKLDLIRLKGAAMTSSDKAQLAKATSEKIATDNAKFDPHGVDYGW